MNKQESDILNTLMLKPFINQRILAEVSGHSLGVVNRSLKELIKKIHTSHNKSNHRIQTENHATRCYFGSRIWYADGSH